MKFPIQGKSLLELREEYGLGRAGFWANDWWSNEAFAKEKPEAGVYEIRLDKKLLKNLTYEEQKKKLPKGFTFPHPAILTEALLSHYKKTGKRLMEDWYSRTSSLGSGGDRVGVGRFGSGGLHVYCSWVDGRDGSLGLSVARKVRELKSRELETVESSPLELPKELVINNITYVRK